MLTPGIVIVARVQLTIVMVVVVNVEPSSSDLIMVATNTSVGIGRMTGGHGMIAMLLSPATVFNIC